MDRGRRAVLDGIRQRVEHVRFEALDAVVEVVVDVVLAVGFRVEHGRD